ncbi:hypothetical protein SDC9_131256 [bioreactor metagenome]|uniref:Uncharacterized protein n=1 Tax=bioreactor metagenome TaxID=1076179 RepID=A0A645D4Q3_9ZZZZ
MIKVAQGCGKLPAAGSGSGNHHDGFGGFDVFIGAVSFVAHNQIDVFRITSRRIVQVNFNAFQLEFVLEDYCGGLFFVPGNNNGSYIDAIPFQVVDALQYVHIIGDAEIGPDFASFDISGIHAHNNLYLVFQFLQKTHFNVRSEAGQNPCCMIIIQNFSSEFEV